jgi:hypothetical protein
MMTHLPILLCGRAQASTVEICFAAQPSGRGTGLLYRNFGMSPVRRYPILANRYRRYQNAREA